MDPAAAWSRLPCRTLGGRIPRQFNSDLSFTTSLCRANYSLYVEAHMRTQAGLHIDPGALAAGPGARELEVVVPYTEWALAEATLQRAAVLAAGLNVRVRLVAVHSVPYAVSFGCPAAVHAHLVEQLVDLASRCQFPVEPQVVMARGWVEGFQYALHPDSTVLVGTRKHFWRTREESLARDLARGGHNVALIHVQ